ncbi:uncharacterized protein LOC144544295 [Carex rostrata]
MDRDPSEGPVLRDRVEEEEDDDSDDEEELLVEEREAEMVSFLNPDKVTKRKAWFLVSTGNVSKTTPLVPSNYSNPSIVAIEDPKFQFKGWCSSPRQWEQWVAKLLPKFGQIWKKVGIFDAILISTYRIRRDPSSIFALVSYWCEETNTFLFPWGEVTITLEDIIILSGLSVLGEPVKSPMAEEMKEVDSRLNEERLKFNRSTSKKAHHSAWMKVFMERDSDELEHAAFLSLWLSRFVFPCHPEMTIRPHVFPIAIRLSYGQRIALAPSVLASIYRDLREMKRCLVNRIGGMKDGPLVVWAPFHILQVWIWERFPGLRPETQNLVKDGEPRAARWHDVGKKLDLGLVQSVFSNPNSFKYRPYAISSSNWYKEGCDELIRDDELRSFAQCLCTCELVGVETIELYLPNRVAMQFGFDQDLPDPFSRVCNMGWEAAWRTYEITADNIGLYVPPQPFEPGVTVNYFSWWREYMLACCNAGIGDMGAGMPQVMVTRENSRGKSKSGSKKARVSSPGDKKRKIQDCYDSTVSDWVGSKVRDIREIGAKGVKGTKGGKSLNHHLSFEEMNNMVLDGSGSGPDLLTPADVIMERADDLPSQVSGSVGDGRGVGFLEMKSITGDILKKVIKEDTAIKQEKVTVEVGERSQEQAVTDRREGCYPSQQETVTTLPVSTVTNAGPKMMPILSDSNLQPNKGANIKVDKGVLGNLNLRTGGDNTGARNLNFKLDGMVPDGEARVKLTSIQEKNSEEWVKMASGGLIQVAIEGLPNHARTAVETQVEAGKESEGGEKIQLDGREQVQGSHHNVDKETTVSESSNAELTWKEGEEQRKAGENEVLMEGLVPVVPTEASEEKNSSNPEKVVQTDGSVAPVVPTETSTVRNTDVSMNEEREGPVEPAVPMHPSRVPEDSRERNPSAIPHNERELLSPHTVPVQVSRERLSSREPPLAPADAAVLSPQGGVSRDRSSTPAVHGRVSMGVSSMDRYAAELRTQRANKEAKELAEIKKLKQEIKDMKQSIMMLEGGPSLS